MYERQSLRISSVSLLLRRFPGRKCSKWTCVFKPYGESTATVGQPNGNSLDLSSPLRYTGRFRRNWYVCLQPILQDVLHTAIGIFGKRL